MKPHTRVPWTMDEIAILKKLWAKGCSPREIQRFLPNHTVEAVRQQRAALKLPNRFNRKKWTLAHKTMVVDSTDQLLHSLAQRMGRSPSSVRNEVHAALMSFARRQKLKEQIAA